MMKMNEETEKFIREFFGDVGREAGLPQRYFIRTVEEFFEFFEFTVIEHLDCHLSVNPFDERNSIFGIEKLFFDFDAETLDLAYKNMMSISWRLKNMGAETLKSFSGRKGYHLYIYLPEILKMPKSSAKIFNRLMLNKIREKINVDYLDAACTKNVACIARTPFSVHPGSSKQCKVLFGNAYNELMKAKENPLPKEIIDEVLEEVKVQIALQEARRLKASRTPNWRKGGYGVRKCILDALADHNVVGGGDHMNRIAFVVEAQHAKWKQELIESKFANRPDFNPQITREKVEDVLGRGYYRFSCVTLDDLGICKNQCGNALKRVGHI